ncbi:hypothetical protein TRFO_07532 [Tritrichomonas foetus]|uniref:Serine/threonine-protein phosphatase n=1 Tax=Tritrichomonas foetus TaxID=1144522 RepID=A0A1J4JR79_9EUKA|nr:hypothetical protein TRFO_07532 [Tritrichomonas foetus]|eukprot:OHT01617.1 hypothetical protein TRFO_07532 [Tritrichomonas foetus]
MANEVYAALEEIIHHDPDLIRYAGVKFPLPRFTVTTYLELFKQAINVLKDQPSLIKVNGRINVVGDIHGNLHDMLRIIKSIGLPKKEKHRVSFGGVSHITNINHTTCENSKKDAVPNQNQSEKESFPAYSEMYHQKRYFDDTNINQMENRMVNNYKMQIHHSISSPQNVFTNEMMQRNANYVKDQESFPNQEKSASNPPFTNDIMTSDGVVFLGDYVDRGHFSLDVITFLLSMLVMFPNKFILLRGNHEFEEINSTYGFRDELNAVFGNHSSEPIYQKINEVFTYLPFAAIINDEVLCCHGGLSPRIKVVEQIKAISRPVEKASRFISDLIWSDPRDAPIFFSENPRGIGCYFGNLAVQDFLTTNNLKFIIRSHECVEHGARMTNNSQVCTVFSSSNYSKYETNRCAYLIVNNSASFQQEISEDNSLSQIITPVIFEPIFVPPREQITFKLSKPNVAILRNSFSINAKIRSTASVCVSKTSRMQGMKGIIIPKKEMKIHSSRSLHMDTVPPLNPFPVK